MCREGGSYLLATPARFSVGLRFGREVLGSTYKFLDEMVGRLLPWRTLADSSAWLLPASPQYECLEQTKNGSHDGKDSKLDGPRKFLQDPSSLWRSISDTRADCARGFYADARAQAVNALGFIYAG